MSKEKLKLKTKRGITLIALVITIIVMLILVAATVTVALNGGLFQSAKKATADTETAREAESELSNGKVQIDGLWYNSIEDYVAGAEGKMTTYDEAKKDADANGYLTQNAEWTDETGKAVIPAGFKVINGKDGEGDQKVGNGLVIQDANGNEFVWIPVEVPEGKTFDEVFYRSNWTEYERTTGLSTAYTEPYTRGYKGEDTDYNAMKASVEKNKGFYIGRYEAGSVEKENPSTRKLRTDTANGTTGVVVKKDQYPYNYVGWGSAMNDIESDINDSKSRDQGKGAVYLSKHFYDNKDVGVVSTLCYSIQWDAMLEFLNKGGNNFKLTDSTEWGNYQNKAWEITNENASYSADGSTWTAFSKEENNTKSKTDSESILLTTGASDLFAAKNIYDIVGNCYEWTMEAFSTSDRVSRGRLLQLRWV